MSTTTPPNTSTNQALSASTPTNSSSQPSSNTATLYLFTFLATILILVLLSASLVLRSYILRRRYRQRFQQALADGLFVDPDRSAFNGAAQFDPLAGFRRPVRRLGPKPVLWDTWIRSPDRDDAWSSITPIAVRCNPSLPPSTPKSSTTPPGSPSPQVQPRPSFLSPLRLPSPFSLSFPSSSPPPRPVCSSSGSPAGAIPQLSRTTPASFDPHATKKDTATLAVCVLVAMPDVSVSIHHPVPNPKGKAVDPLESQARHQSGDADPLLSAASPGSGPLTHDFAEEEGLPLLEFGVVEMNTGDWVWTT